MNYSLTAKAALLAHIEALNTERQAKQDAEPGSWFSKWPTDDDYINELIEYGVTTADEFDRMQLATSISECSKAATGHRINSDWREHTLQELEEILDGWVSMANQQYEWEKDCEQREQEERENLASQCHVTVDQIIEWESSEYNWCKISFSYPP